jgi:hypothetical protein
MRKNRSLSLSSVIALAVSSKLVSAQVSQEWVARYDGPAHFEDTAYAIAVDGGGNVHVTGSACVETMIDAELRDYCSRFDYATVKYGADGNQLWVARYSGSADGVNEATAIALDGAGNVYVTGYSYGIGTLSDYATVKYDADGNELWVARYDGPASSYDIALAIALDGAGNVYVTGGSRGVGTDYDYATVKYDADGNELWVARYNGPGNSSDQASAIALDASGNVYVTGESTGVGRAYDYATVKYDADGNELWVARYHGPVNFDDVATAIAIGPAGNVYVTGSSFGVGTGYDYATVKYDADGNQLWVARYNGPGNQNDLAYAIALDAAGNVHVTGGTFSFETDSDYATVKYDADGNELWAARYNGPGNSYDAAFGIAVDAAGKVYVTGGSVGVGTGEDYATVKYDADGNELWVARYNGPGNAYDVATAIAVDAAGKVYVTGTSYGGIDTNFDYATVKYTQN